MGLEIAEDMPDVAAVLVPIGGGGLAAGVAAAISALAPDARVIGVEPELAADARDSLAQDRIVAWPADQVGRTIADGTRTQSIGRLNFAHLRVQLDAVSPSPSSRSRRPSGSRPRRRGSSSSRRAPSRSRRCGSTPRRPGCWGSTARSSACVSGGNVDPDRYLEYLQAPIPPEG